MKSKPQYIQLDITWRSLVKVVLLGVGLYVLLLLRDILIMLLVVFIFVAAVNPTITHWQTYMSRSLAVSLFYVLMLALLVFLSYLVVPDLIHQINLLVRQLPAIADRIRPTLESPQYVGLLDQTVTAAHNLSAHLSDNILETTYGFFGRLATAITGLVISFYLLLEEQNAKDFFHQILPHHRFEAVYMTVSKISTRMGQWVRGQFLLMLIIAASYLVIFLIFQVPGPLPLAIWAGVCEVIPIIGALLGLVPAILVTLTTAGAIKALILALVGFLGIQQLEAHIIVPRVMGKAVGLSPVLVIISLLIGLKLFGFVGAVMAIPTAAVISVIIGEWPSLRRIWEDEEEA